MKLGSSRQNEKTRRKSPRHPSSFRAPPLGRAGKSCEGGTMNPLFKRKTRVEIEAEVAEAIAAPPVDEQIADVLGLDDLPTAVAKIRQQPVREVTGTSPRPMTKSEERERETEV